MPNYKTHILTAAISYYIIIFVFALYNKPALTIFQWFISILAGAMFPDIDIKSKGQKLFYVLFLNIIILALIFESYYLGISIGLFSFVPILVKHRGLFHNIWFLLILIFVTCKILVSIFPEYQNLIISNSIFFLIGVNTHLWLDLGIKKMFRLR